MKTHFLNAIGVGAAMILGGFIGTMTSSFDGGPVERVQETAIRTVCGTLVGLAAWIVFRIAAWVFKTVPNP